MVYILLLKGHRRQYRNGKRRREMRRDIDVDVNDDDAPRSRECKVSRR